VSADLSDRCVLDSTISIFLPQPFAHLLIISHHYAGVTTDSKMADSSIIDHLQHTSSK